MPESEKDLYAASCNPPRRAKRLSVSISPSSPTHPRAILPMPFSATADQGGSSPSVAKRGRKPSNAAPPAASSSSAGADRPYIPRTNPVIPAEPVEAPPPPAKRGRKPGPLSKSAREAQRRLNHSIIEKARRTKINDALATLKQLVPSDYLQTKQMGNSSASKEVEDDEDEDEDDDDYEASSKKSKPKPKGKKEEKEKEFKLEILVRTVVFLQDLLEKVETLESAAAPTVCQNCGTEVKASKKRKRSQEDEVVGAESVNIVDGPSSPPAKIPRKSSSNPKSVNLLGHSPALVATSTTSTTASSPQVGPTERERLPSISSWLLPNSEIDPQLLPSPLVNSNGGSSSSGSNNNNGNASNKPFLSPLNTSYLPSPPSSTHFDPVRTTTQNPPILSLGPVATAAMVSSSSPSATPGLISKSNSSNITVRTPDDESAASLLLRIATSPTFRPVSVSSTSTPGPGGYPMPLPDPSNFSLHSDVRSQTRDHVEQRRQQAQTPSSILGMRKY